ncbi:MAG TPA: OBAP family protein [Tepidisphaeraceae bacterium]|jgi:hypothetical protein
MNVNMMKHVLVAAMAVGILLVGCKDDDSKKADAPGDAKTPKSHALEMGADMIQSKAPLAAIDMYLNGFHFYADDMGRQVEAHHYCSRLNEDVHQCVIYDSNEKNARLIGIEYIISEKLFRTLPEEEKRLWHSHRYEVKSGELVMPGIPTKVEHEAMEQIVGTYGKTFHTWQVDRGDKLPLGIPQLMMAFVQDGQLKPEVVKARDQRLEVSMEKKREDRRDIAEPASVPGADPWTSGRTVQLQLQELPAKVTTQPSR